MHKDLPGNVSAYQTSPVPVSIPAVATLPKNTKTSCSLSLPFPWEQAPRGCARSDTHLHKQYTSLLACKKAGVGAAQTPPPPILFLQEPGPLTEPCYQCKRLVGPAREKCHKGEKRIKIPEMMGLQCSFAHFLCLIKTTQSQRLELRWASRAAVQS